MNRLRGVKGILLEWREMREEIPHSYRGRIAPSPTGICISGMRLLSGRRSGARRRRGGAWCCAWRTWICSAARRSFARRFLRICDGLESDGRGAGLRRAVCALCAERAAFLLFFGVGEIAGGRVYYPCRCSRKDVMGAVAAPHEGEDEPVYPGTCRPAAGSVAEAADPAGVTWRFRVPDGEEMTFRDGRMGPRRAIAGVDFGDFVIWRKDDVPAYQLGVVADDAAMRITEVVRGEDLLMSTFRQILLYRALGWEAPAFYHCALVRDEKGERLAKRSAALSLRGIAGRDALIRKITERELNHEGHEEHEGKNYSSEFPSSAPTSKISSTGWPASFAAAVMWLGAWMRNFSTPQQICSFVKRSGKRCIARMNAASGIPVCQVESNVARDFIGKFLL